MKVLLIALSLVSVSAFAYPHHHDDGVNVCAYAYEAPRYQGEILTVTEGTFKSNLHHVRKADGEGWNNSISSIYVKPGCQLVGFQYDNFGRHYRTGQRIGASQVYTHGGYEYLGYMDNLISSFTCHCR